MTFEEIWKNKSDRELEIAANEITNYTEEAEQIIRSELRRRGMVEPPEFTRGMYGLLFTDKETETYLKAQVQAIHQGRCPRCGGCGPVDVHMSYWIWSAILLTHWGTSQNICCRKCARNKQIIATLLCSILGWWGFPWGFLRTPIQIFLNLVAIFKGPDPSQPSRNLYFIVHKQLTDH